MLKLLYESVKDKPAQRPFLSVIRHFLLIRDEDAIRYACATAAAGLRVRGSLPRCGGERARILCGRLPRYHYWVLIERVVSQIILAGKGIDPAFDNTYKVSVEQLMSGLVETDKVRGVGLGGHRGAPW